jgi:hypothetical protein
MFSSWGRGFSAPPAAAVEEREATRTTAVALSLPISSRLDCANPWRYDTKDLVTVSLSQFFTRRATVEVPRGALSQESLFNVVAFLRRVSYQSAYEEFDLAHTLEPAQLALACGTVLSTLQGVGNLHNLVTVWFVIALVHHADAATFATLKDLLDSLPTSNLHPRFRIVSYALRHPEQLVQYFNVPQWVSFNSLFNLNAVKSFVDDGHLPTISKRAAELAITKQRRVKGDEWKLLLREIVSAAKRAATDHAALLQGLSLTSMLGLSEEEGTGEEGESGLEGSEDSDGGSALPTALTTSRSGRVSTAPRRLYEGDDVDMDILPKVSKSKRKQPPGRAVGMEAEKEWEVEAVVGHKRSVLDGVKGTIVFEVKFVGYPELFDMEAGDLALCGPFHDYLEEWMGAEGGLPDSSSRKQRKGEGTQEQEVGEEMKVEVREEKEEEAEGLAADPSEALEEQEAPEEQKASEEEKAPPEVAVVQDAANRKG